MTSMPSDHMMAMKMMINEAQPQNMKPGETAIEFAERVKTVQMWTTFTASIQQASMTGYNTTQHRGLPVQQMGIERFSDNGFLSFKQQHKRPS
ncbi:hypothetical protein LXL04_028349 [Taraxacum kok-saghyz]